MSTLRPMDEVGKMFGRTFGMGEIKESLNTNPLNIRFVSLDSHIQCHDVASAELSGVFEAYDQNGMFSNSDEKEKLYFLTQLAEYISGLPNSADVVEKMNNSSLEDVLTVAYGFVSAGTNQHNERFNPKHISESIDIHNPMETKCSVFNRLFQMSYSALVNKYCPTLGETHKLVSTPAIHALDLPRNKGASGKSKLIPHRYLTMASGNGHDLVVSALDPYHSRSTGKTIFEKIDFTETRSADSLSIVLDLLYQNIFVTGPSKNNLWGETLKALTVTQKISESTDVAEAGEFAMLLAYQYEFVKKNLSNMSRIRAEKVASLKSGTAKYQEHKNSRISRSFVDTYRKSILSQFGQDQLGNSYNSVKYSEKFLNEFHEQVVNSMEHTIDALVESLTGKVDFKSALILFDLADTIGSFEIPIGEDSWKKIEDVVASLADSPQIWKDSINTQKPWSTYLERRYQNAWGSKPMELTVLNKDKEITSTEDTKWNSFVNFRANSLNFANKLGWVGWKKFIPQVVPEGSYLQVLINKIKD